ncbi:MAG: HEAT repeat domain-containing protein [Treponema sp.]|nr:HEAT repeat domain-containing protein [Treponema sp.]
MKIILSALIFLFCALPVFCQEADNALSVQERSVQKAVAGFADVPPAKRPRAPNSEKSEEAALNDEGKNAVQEYSETLQYGVSPEIIELIDKFIKNDDPRFVDEIYDVFQKTKTPSVREKVFEYFAHFKDPCLEDYAVEILNDPYDTKDSTVSLVFKYVSDVRCKPAIPAVIRLLELDDTKYFEGALTTLGEIGDASEALYLADFIERDDLTMPQRQALARVLGKLGAVETWEKLSFIAQNEDENTFIRMYAAEAIGNMKKQESIPILVELYEAGDPNFRQYVIKGLANYPESAEAKAVIMQGIRDEHYKVRLESIAAVKKLNMSEASPYLIYRAKNDKEKVVKNACYDAIAVLGTKDGIAYLVSILEDKKAGDTTKAEAVKALIANNAGETHIIALAQETLKDDLHKPLRYAIGKELAKYGKPSYEAVCRSFLSSKDVATVSLGLDIYKKGRYGGVTGAVQSLVADKRAGVNQTRARKILGMEEDATDGTK